MLAELVAVSEQLVAAADGQQGRAVLHRERDRVALGPEHVLGDQCLVAVLPAADVDQVMLARREAITGTGRLVAEGNSPPLAAPLEEDHVAAVGVDVHLLGVEGEQAEFCRAVHSGTSRRTIVESASLSPELICRRRAGRKPAFSPSLSRVAALTR